MAQAKRDVTTHTIKKVIEVEEEEVTITLTLTQDEADLLRGVLGHISGGSVYKASPKTVARREMSDDIWKALYDAGARSIGNPFEKTPELSDIDQNLENTF